MPRTHFINSLTSHNDLKRWVPLLYYMKEERKTQRVCTNCPSSARWWGQSQSQRPSSGAMAARADVRLWRQCRLGQNQTPVPEHALSPIGARVDAPRWASGHISLPPCSLSNLHENAMESLNGKSG